MFAQIGRDNLTGKVLPCADEVSLTKALDMMMIRSAAHSQALKL